MILGECFTPSLPDKADGTVPTFSANKQIGEECFDKQLFDEKCSSIFCWRQIVRRTFVRWILFRRQHFSPKNLFRRKTNCWTNFCRKEIRGKVCHEQISGERFVGEKFFAGKTMPHNCSSKKWSGDKFSGEQILAIIFSANKLLPKIIVRRQIVCWRKLPRNWGQISSTDWYFTSAVLENLIQIV